MENNPKVCVIMPVYNGANTIKLALKSLLAQSYKHWICVIVNDGSSDRTKDILDSLKDSRFKVYHLPRNKGRGYARQYALEHAEGDYLAYLDADDFYHEDKLKLQVELLESRKDVFLVGTGTLTFERGYKPLNTRGCYDLKVSVPFRDGAKLRVMMPSVMLRLDRAGKYQYNSRLNAGEDLDYFSRYLNGKLYANIGKVLLYYNLGPTTYKKVLAYTYNEILRGTILIRRNVSAGIGLIFSSIFKFFIYLIFIPILGLDFFMNKRGHTADASEIQEFGIQYKICSNETCL